MCCHRCLQSVVLERIQESFLLLTAATDGIIAVWLLQPETFVRPSHSSSRRPPQPPPTLLASLSAHQSGVLAMHVHWLSNGPSATCLVISGGDDNALAIHKLQLDLSDSIPTCRILANHCVASAHASSVTAVEMVSASSALSAGSDGRLIRWSVHPESLVSHA